MALRHEKARAIQGEVERVRRREDCEEIGVGVWVGGDRRRKTQMKPGPAFEASSNARL